MLVPFDTYVDEAEFRRLLLKHFPELEKEIEGDEGLVHLEIGALSMLANTYIKKGEMDSLKKIYEFVGDLSRHQKEVDPGVINAVHVSFLEKLNFSNKKHGDIAKRLLPAVLLSMWQAQMAHNRRIGLIK